MNFYQIMDRMDAWIETDTWFYIEAGIMIGVIVLAIVVYFVRKFGDGL